MKKGLILTAFIALTMYVVLVFALDSSQNILPNLIENSSNMANSSKVDNSTNISVIIASPVNPLTNIFYGGTRMQTTTNSKSRYTNRYSKSSEQIRNSGDRIQTTTNSKSKYDNRYTITTGQIEYGGDDVQTETNSKSRYTNGYN